MVETPSSITPGLSSPSISDQSRDEAESPKRVCFEGLKEYSSIPWLTESWLGKVVTYERIATATPALGVGIIGQALLNHHINLLPNITGLADFTPVRNGNGQHLGYRPKVATWPLSKPDLGRFISSRSDRWEVAGLQARLFN